MFVVVVAVSVYEMATNWEKTKFWFSSFTNWFKG